MFLPIQLNPSDKKYQVARDASHHVKAIAVICIDPRFRDPILRYLADRYGEGNFDVLSHAGGAKQFAEKSEEKSYGLSDIEIGINLHHASEVIHINHEDCGKYGGSKKFKDFDEEFEFHQKQLAKAEQTIWEKFPAIENEKVFYTFDGPREL